MFKCRGVHTNENHTVFSIIYNYIMHHYYVSFRAENIDNRERGVYIYLIFHFAKEILTIGDWLLYVHHCDALFILYIVMNMS